jgi:predicted O-linked N-acetylglucosamine transferase (SPINDLY family)
LKSGIRPHSHRPDPDRRLRIGYLSPHDRNHPELCLTVPLFANHDHDAFEVFAYPQVDPEESATGRL